MGDEVHGPIDFVLVEFPGTGIGDETAAALVRLVEQGMVRVYDLLVLRKAADGTFEALAVEDLGDEAGSLSYFAGARTGLLGDDDVGDAAGVLESGTTALALLYENTWAIPFVGAALDAGGNLVAGMRIPAQDVMDALDELERQS